MGRYPVVRTLFFLILTSYILPFETSRLSVWPNNLVSYSIPQNRALKKALGYHEDIYFNFTELTNKYEYPTEVHTVTTEDGYILGVFRILPKCSDKIKPDPVLLMHGIFDTADLWIVSGTKIGLGFVLARNCYDVWAANHRGNNYSRRHVKLDPDKDPEFWNYSFDEHGNYDIPAIIDYILQTTGRPKLFYIGHSQGSTDYFVMNSLKPEYNDKIKLAIQLGPVAWIKHLSHPVAVIGAQNYIAIKTFVESAGLDEIFGRDHIGHVLIQFLCVISPQSCDIGLSLTTGHKPGTIPIERIPVLKGHLFSGSSIKNLAHFAQLLLSGNFQRYDEGIHGNIKRYGSPKPPQYNISQITYPVALFSAQNDLLSSLKDVDILVTKLPNLIENYVVPEPYWSHYNHIWSENAPRLVFSKILEYFDKFKD